MKQKELKAKRNRRQRRVRARIFGTAHRPRLAVFRSHKHIYAQLIDDRLGRTLAAASDFSLEKKSLAAAKKSALAVLVGRQLAEVAAKKKVRQAIFDRRGHVYTGRIKALAEGARTGGLEF